MLYMWFLQQRAKGTPVSGLIIQEKTLQLFSMLYPESTQAFKTSSRQLHRFCARHGIKVLSLQGSKTSFKTIQSSKSDKEG